MRNSSQFGIDALSTVPGPFGALIERRSYKPPLTRQAAYQILLDMRSKLDQALVRAFRPVANLGVAERTP